MTIEQAIEYATSGQSSGGPITQDALSVLAVAAQDRHRLLGACERFLKARSKPHVVPAGHEIGGSFFLPAVAGEKKNAFDDLVSAVKSIGGLTE